jgi:hypothetical protein
MRLAGLFAILDKQAEIERIHLKAALALWEYSEASIHLVFGDSTGSPIADTILHALRASGGMDDTAISSLFQRHVPANRLSQAKAMLHAAGVIYPEHTRTDGRQRIIWRSVAKKAK